MTDPQPGTDLRAEDETRLAWRVLRGLALVAGLLLVVALAPELWTGLPAPGAP